MITPTADAGRTPTQRNTPPIETCLRVIVLSFVALTLLAAPREGAAPSLPPLDTRVIVGSGLGGQSQVRVFDGETAEPLPAPLGSFTAFTQNPIAGCDLNSDGTDDIIVSSGPGKAPQMGVFDGATGNVFPPPLGSFLAFNQNFLGGVYVACGDLTGDDIPEIIAARGGLDKPEVRVFDGVTAAPLPPPLGSFLAFNQDFLGGVRVAACDLNQDGRTDIIATRGPLGQPDVRTFDGTTGTPLAPPLGSFLAFNPSFLGGVHIACSDLSGDTIPDIIAARGLGKPPEVRVFDGVTAAPLPPPFGSFHAFNPKFLGGVRLAACDLNHDGRTDIIAGRGEGAQPEVRTFDGVSGTPFAPPLGSFLAFNASFKGGVYVACSPIEENRGPPPEDAPAVTGTTPSNGAIGVPAVSGTVSRAGATGVAVDTNITVNFSESVAITAAAQAPVAAFHFNEGSGSTTANLGGGSGTITGATWSTAGKNGGALSFDGAGDTVSVSDYAALDLTNKMTLSAWVRPNALNDWTTVIMKERSGGLAYALYGSDNTNRPPAVYASIGGADRSAVGSGTLPLNTWTYLAGTYDGANFRLYVNGVLVKTQARTGNIATSNSPLRFGGNNVWGEYFNGLIDDIRVYNVVLTQPEIQTDMNTPVGPSAPPDTTAPAVNITAPGEGARVSGTVTITANASDNVGVSGVQFLVNGSTLGAEDTVAPYTATWNTAGLAAGTYSLTGRARDAAGNPTTSTPVNAVVSGDFSFTVTQPTITMPSSGDSFYEVNVAYLNGFTSSQLDLYAEGLPAGVTGRFLFDPMVHQGTTEFLVTTAGIAAGNYTFTLGARDLDGSGITHTQQVTLIIDNTPDFSLTATPQTQNVTAGGSADYTINVTSSGGFNGSVNFSAGTLPAGINPAFTPASLTPPGATTLRLSTTGAVTPGTYTITVNAGDGAITRSTQVSLTVTASSATWNVGTIGSTGTPNNNVRVGKVRTDNLNRVYVGTIGTGRMLEYTWNGTAWSSPVDAGGSPTNQEIHDVTIGRGRGDAQERIYAASYDHNVYEIWHDGSGWRQVTVATLDDLGMHAAVGDGRGDGVTRLYLISTRSLYEYTWNGTAWVGAQIGNTPGAHGIVVAAPRGAGQMGLYVASISSGSFEARWNGSAWTVSSMGDSGDVRNIYTGNGRNDGVTRVYGGLLDGRMREYSWNGSAWSIVNAPAAPGGIIHSYVTTGRGDGSNRVYGSSTDGKLYEYTWNGSAWGTPLNMGGGPGYMYGQHFGNGRNDGIIRFYSADRGSVNRVYEYTWTGAVADSQRPTAPSNLTATASAGTVTLNWSAATDNLGVARYNVHRANVSGFTPSSSNLIGQSTSLTYADSGLASGTYYYVVTAQDAAGNTGPASNQASATTTSDTENPTVSLTSPATGSTVSGTVTLSANATDNSGAPGVTFLVDGAAVGSEDTAAPYSLSWNSASVANGQHIIAARARYAAGNTATSASVTITVNNTGPADLVVAYGFNEGSGSVAASSAGSNNGSVINAAWTTAGRYGNALSFDGAGDRVSIADANVLDLTAGMTLEAWVRPNNLNGWTTVILKEAGSTLSYSLYGSDNTNRPLAGYVQIGGDQAVTGPSNLALGNWSHLAVTYDGSTLRLYVNGTQVATRSLSGSITTSAGALSIGGNNVWGEWFNGLIDEIRIYNRALTATEIQTDMNTAVN